MRADSGPSRRGRGQEQADIYLAHFKISYTFRCVRKFAAVPGAVGGFFVLIPVTYMVEKSFLKRRTMRSRRPVQSGAGVQERLPVVPGR